METKTKIMSDKIEIRREILKQRNKLLTVDKQTSPEKMFLDQCIKAHVLMYDMQNPCQNYLCYVNYKSEVKTTDIIDYLFSHGKKVYVPKVFGKEMEFYQIADTKELVCGYQSILEPLGEESRKFIPKHGEKYRMLIPGCVFDKNGGRIGYGGGYYDKYLAMCIEKGIMIEKIALAYELQVIKQVPTEPFDIKMDRIFTEKGNIL